MIKNKNLTIAFILFTVWLYGAWAAVELLLMPVISGAINNQYAIVLIRDLLIKNLVWTLPALLLIKRFSEDMLIGMKELLSFRRESLKYLLIAAALAVFVLGGVILRTHGLALSSSFHPSKLIVALLVGFTEETVFRGFFLNATLKHDDSEPKKYIAVAVNAVMFLAIHFPVWISSGVFAANLTSFSFVTIIVLSALFSFCLMRCRNIWVAVILHSFYDLLVFMFV
ncbi:MAG: CPBP family intramembrane metalloprotease [Clostridia bacterium]|nr:CPBP family intramembrane metalloprotease [Clostridia bacterium]